MRAMIAVGALLLVGAFAALVSGVLGPSEEGVFHPDHTRVMSGFQDAASELVGGGGVSSVPPESECKQVDEATWRCYRRWAPLGKPGAAEILQADVNVYPDRVVVGEVDRLPDLQ